MKRWAIFLLEAVVLVLSVVWMLQECSIESVITCVGSISTLFASVWIKDPKKKISESDVTLQNSHGNIVVLENKGNIKINTSGK